MQDNEAMLLHIANLRGGGGGGGGRTIPITTEI